MSKLLAVALFACVLAVGVGCQHHKKESAKACAACEGTKDAKAKADCGTCKTQEGAESVTKTNEAAGDACSHCPGVQAAKADGSCPVCPAKAQ